MALRTTKKKIKKSVVRTRSSSVNLKKTPLRKKEHLCIIKRRTGACEPYDEKKVYGSIYAACYVVHMREQECEHVAQEITAKITAYLKKKKRCSSVEIKNQVQAYLKKHNEHVAFMYETHNDIN